MDANAHIFDVTFEFSFRSFHFDGRNECRVIVFQFIDHELHLTVELFRPETGFDHCPVSRDDTLPILAVVIGIDVYILNDLFDLFKDTQLNTR